MSLLRTRSVSRCSEAVPTHFSYTRPRKVSNVRFIATSSNARRSGIKPSYFWYPLCLALGLGIGYQVRVLACPPDLPTPGSKEDHVALGALAADIDQLHIVKTLRAQEYNLHTDVALTESATGQPAWIELDIRNTIADDRDQKENKPIRTLTQSSMAGARGLGVQRAFWNPITRELVAVVWCGGALTGWPGLTHGGAIATMFEELFSRAVAGPDRPLNSISSPSSLSITYARPTQALNFYVMRASFSQPDIPQQAPPQEQHPAKSWLPSWKDFTKKRHSTALQPTVELSGTLESLEGKVCVRAKASYPVSDVHVGNI